ncbi:MAG: transcription elongation factor GreA [Tissierellia bacterium]|nr:transcription elongation factor GreA [Tissierellia bacterium]
MVGKVEFFTRQGLEEKKEELETLKSEGRRAVAEKIKVALGYGDLSENSEYDEAKNEQAQLEEKIAKLDLMIRNAKVIEEEDLSEDEVRVGALVYVKDLASGEEDEYNIVGSAEADPLEGKISNESPVGAGLLGKSVGDVAEIDTPQGLLRLEVIKIAIE